MHSQHIVPNISQVPIKVSHWRMYSTKRLSRLHYHSEAELLACRGGIIGVVVNNVKHYVYDGEVIFINSRVPHETFSEIKGSKNMYIQFRIEDFLPSHSEEIAKYLTYLRRNTTKAVHIIKNPAVFNAMCAILDECKQNNLGSTNMIYANMHIICGMLSRDNVFLDYTKTDVQSLQKLLPSFNYIENNYSNDISLEEISATAGFNKHYFCRLFKKECGIGFSEYLNLVRVFKAQKMLKNTNKTIIEIAFDTGFSSISHFNRVFKKHIGCTPTIYRRAAKINT